MDNKTSEKLAKQLTAAMQSIIYSFNQEYDTDIAITAAAIDLNDIRSDGIFSGEIAHLTNTDPEIEAGLGQGIQEHAQEKLKLRDGKPEGNA